MNELYRKLREYSESGIYPCHMPGHKRHRLGEMPRQLWEIDITEVEGFDNLHEAEGILARIQERAAGLYGASESFCLVGGSSCGVQAAIGACVRPGGRLLMARASHRSAYYGAYMRRVNPVYLYSGWNEELGVIEAVSPGEVARTLEEHPDAEAVLIVSPTYEGRVADVAAIADLVHRRGIPLIVDEAHGAHLGFHPAWHASSVGLGADIVIHSIHKTLPAPTQTALMHINGSLINREKLRRFLKIYQTSSPSYILLAGIEECLDVVETRGDSLFTGLERNWSRLLEELGTCRGLRFPRREDRGQDIGKLVISTEKIGLSGWQLYDMLLEKYHIQLEMAGASYALAMMTLGDDEEGFRRLREALLDMDREACLTPVESGVDHHGGKPLQGKGLSPYLMSLAPEAVLPLEEAWERPTDLRRLSECVGKVSGGFVSLYPPGIPFLVPGERVEQDLVHRLGLLLESGVRIQGIEHINAKDYGMRILI